MENTQTHPFDEVDERIMSELNFSVGAVQQTPLANLSSLAAEGGNTVLELAET